MGPINDMLQRQRMFVSDASHELRTPLTILRANAEMLGRTPNVTRDEVRAELGHMINEMDAMSMLVDELLEISRLDHPDHEFEILPMRLAPTLERVKRLMSPLATAAGVDLVIGPTNISILGNAPLVERMLRIVLDNAIKYTPEGGTVTLATSKNRDSATIEIRDTGIGISPDDQRHVFDRFFRADKARTRSTGTGLGLAIASSLATTLHGAIELESTPGTGTCVRITLPLAD
jgi:signal transduction histidine kinase